MLENSRKYTRPQIDEIVIEAIADEPGVKLTPADLDKSIEDNRIDSLQIVVALEQAEAKLGIDYGVIPSRESSLRDVINKFATLLGNEGRLIEPGKTDPEVVRSSKNAGPGFTV